MLRVEFHCHTIYSKDCLVKPAELVEACRKKAIDRVVITDHNTIEGALRAVKIDPQRVIVGEEIMTTQGELLAAFMTEFIPPNLSPEETIDRLRQQGAFISVSHPFDQARHGHWQPEHLLRISPLIDAIEIFNARCIRARSNEAARSFAIQNNLPGTVGSDAHATFELGKATLLLPDFLNAEELRLAIHQAQIEATLSSPWVHFVSRYAVWRKKMVV